MTVGVLALQGDFREHIAVLRSLDADAVEVRTPEQLAAVGGLVIPGGESTTIGRLANVFGMMEPLRRSVGDGLPVLGTCAGMIFLATATTDGEQPQLAVLDVVVERNAFGRQVESFEVDLAVSAPGPMWREPVHAVFIRAPLIDKVGSEVEVMATVPHPKTGEPRPVIVRQGRILAAAFHPELAGETRLHRLLLDLIDEEH